MRALAVVVVFVASPLACVSLGSLAGGSDDQDAAVPDRSAPDAVSVGDAADDVVTCLADLQTDPLNCGRCKASCFGGMCTEGRCSPVAFSITDGTGLGSDATNVYVGSKSGVLRFAKAGKLDIKPITAPFDAGGTIEWRGVAATGKKVFATVYAAPPPGVGGIYAISASPPGQTLLFGTSSPARLLVRDTTAFFIDDFNNAVTSVDIDSQVRTLKITDNARSAVDDIALDDTYFYWLRRADSSGLERASLHRSKRTAMKDEVVSADVDHASKIAADGTAVYVAVRDQTTPCPAGAITRFDTVTLARTILVDKEACPYGLAADGKYVYWTTDGPDGTALVRRVSVAGGKPETLAGALPSGDNIIVDDDGIYWLTFSQPARLYMLGR